MDEKLIAQHMETLGITREEAIELISYDKEVDKMTMKEVDNDLSDEQKKCAKKARQSDRKPTIYQFKKRERKENPTKASIIAEIARFLQENSENAVENLEITNKERQIAFKIGENAFEITLTQKRKPKK